MVQTYISETSCSFHAPTHHRTPQAPATYKYRNSRGDKEKEKSALIISVFCSALAVTAATLRGKEKKGRESKRIMYAEAGLLFPYFQSFSQEVQHLEEFCRIQKSNARVSPSVFSPFPTASLPSPFVSKTLRLGEGQGEEKSLKRRCRGESVLACRKARERGTYPPTCLGVGGNLAISPEISAAVCVKTGFPCTLTIQDQLCVGFSCCEVSPNGQGNIAQSSTVLEYDLGGEGDLFKAPEPIIEEPIMGLESLDPMTAAISMISAGDSVISSEAIKVADIESIQSNQLLSDVFYECKKDLLEKSAIKESFPEVLDINIPSIQNGEKLASEKDQSTVISMGPMQKSVSSGSLSSMEWINGGSMKPKFLDFETMDLGAAFGMRRAFSDGDIRTLGNCNTNLIHSPFGLAIGNFTIEERKQKLSRYRKKKTKRNFGRKIKYACRKALADNQPRVRGRFARTEAADVSNTSPPSRTTVNILTKK
ncbi:hypothetical protein ACLOJK_010241 [Asimina triloba]